MFCILPAKLFILTAILWFGQISFAQDSCILRFDNDNFEKEIFGKNFKPDTLFPNEALAIKSLNEMLLSAYRAGYLLANYNIITKQDSIWNIVWNANRRINWVYLNTDSIDPLIINASGYKEKKFTNTPYSHYEVVALMEALIEYTEMHGYPFATVWLSDLFLQDTLLTASIQLDKGRIIRFTGIEVRGDLQLSENYLAQYTGIKKGRLYNQLLINEIDPGLKELPFVNFLRPTQIEFIGNDARVVTFLDNKNASKFDVVIGVLPNNEVTGRLLVTGDGNLRLYNIFSAGELFDLRFRQLESSTKELQTSLNYPYLPSLPVGLDMGFSLFLRDSTFLERKANAGVLFHFRGNNYLKGFISFYNSDILQIDTAYVLANKTLPPNVDLKINSYGIGGHYEKLDYLYNPRQGIFLEGIASAGIKTIKKNAAIVDLSDPVYPDYDFESVYDSVDLNSLSLNYELKLKWFIPVFSHATILTGFQSAGIINNQIFNNELYRIGGNSILRGFDEQSILVSSYYIFTAEYRYLLSKNSFVQLFTDIGYTINESVKPALYDVPIGFGTGINFETKAGIFGLSYALGKTNEMPVLFRNAKIHFGYLNYF